MSSGSRPPQAPEPSAGAAQTSPSPLVSPQLVDLRGAPAPRWASALGGGACPCQSQLASRLLNFLSRTLRPPACSHPCLGIRSSHPQPPLACRVVLVNCQRPVQLKPRPHASGFVSPPPHSQPWASWNGTFPDAPALWVPLPAPSPVAVSLQRARQLPGLSRHGAPLPPPPPSPPPPPPPPPPPTPRLNFTKTYPSPPFVGIFGGAVPLSRVSPASCCCLLPVTC